MMQNRNRHSKTASSIRTRCSRSPIGSEIFRSRRARATIDDRNDRQSRIDAPRSPIYRARRVLPKNLVCVFLTIRALCA
jgi:hypothetical protein